MYTKIHDRIWAMFRRRGLNSTERLVYIYLFSCSHRNVLGFYRLPLSYISEDLELSLKTVKKIIPSLKMKNLVAYSENDSMILIKKFLDSNPIPNPNVEIKAAKLAESSEIPDCDLWAEMLEEVEPLMVKLPALYASVLKRFCKRYGKQFDIEYGERYGNTESRKHKAENRIQKAESSTGGDAALAGCYDVKSYYQKFIGPLTPGQVKKLMGYTESMGTDVVQMAIDRAVRRMAKSFAYVDKILTDWKAHGVTSADMIVNEDARYSAQKSGIYQDPRYVPGEADKRARTEMDRLAKWLAEEKAREAAEGAAREENKEK